jgi:hypothetical protein
LSRLLAGGTKDRPTPAKLLAQLEAHQGIRVGNIELFLEARSMWTQARMTEDRRRQVAHLVRNFYRELAELGRPVFRLKSLQARQARLLVDSWVAKGLAFQTIQTKYNSLSSWRLTLGQHAAIDRLVDLLPEGYAEREEPRGTTRPRLDADLIRERSDVLREIGLRRGDLTAWVVDRLCRSFDISISTALSLRPDGVESVDGVLVAKISTERGREQVSLIAATPQRRSALTDAVDYCRQQGRGRLANEGGRAAVREEEDDLAVSIVTPDLDVTVGASGRPLDSTGKPIDQQRQTQVDETDVAMAFLKGAPPKADGQTGARTGRQSDGHRAAQRVGDDLMFAEPGDGVGQ